MLLILTDSLVCYRIQICGHILVLKKPSKNDDIWYGW